MLAVYPTKEHIKLNSLMGSTLFLTWAVSDMQQSVFKRDQRSNTEETGLRMVHVVVQLRRGFSQNYIFIHSGQRVRGMSRLRGNYVMAQRSGLRPHICSSSTRIQQIGIFLHARVVVVVCHV